MAEEEEEKTDDVMEIQENVTFPLLLSEKNDETGEIKRYYVKIGEYNKNLIDSVDLMSDDGVCVC